MPISSSDRLPSSLPTGPLLLIWVLTLITAPYPPPSSSVTPLSRLLLMLLLLACCCPWVVASIPVLSSSRPWLSLMCHRRWLLLLSLFSQRTHIKPED